MRHSPAVLLIGDLLHDRLDSESRLAVIALMDRKPCGSLQLLSHGGRECRGGGGIAGGRRRIGAFRDFLEQAGYRGDLSFDSK
jgi:hypothetical protein